MSCLLDGQPKFIKRIPDATFGLATFQPQYYQSYPDSFNAWDLVHDRLEALLLHRHCGLISDPRWGFVNLVFPFAVYEAKGWRGDPREARQQACSAGAVYLDMLDRLARKPGINGEKAEAYQTSSSRNHQVFVFTSFGAHWHVLLGYRRPRLEREFAACKGVSKSVYVSMTELKKLRLEDLQKIIGLSKNLEWPGGDKTESMGASIFSRSNTLLGSDRSSEFRHSAPQSVALFWETVLR